MKRFALLLLALVALLCSCGENKGSDEDIIKNLKDLDKYILVGDYKGVTVDIITITDTDVESRITSIQKEHAYFKKIDRTKVEANDNVHIKYTSYLDGKAFTGGSGEDDLIVGEGTYEYKEVEIQLLGATVGNPRTINVTLPDDYYSIGLRGKTIKMEVTVTQIQESKETLPEITDAFVKEKFDAKDVAEFKANVRKDLEKEAEDKMYTNAWNAALENCAIIDYPEGIIEDYVASMKAYYTEEAKKYGAGLEYIVGNVSEWEAEATQFAKDYYKSEIAMYYILDKEIGRDVSDEEYDKRLEAYAKEQEVSVKDLEKIYTKDELITSMHWDKVMEFIWENAVKE